MSASVAVWNDGFQLTIVNLCISIDPVHVIGFKYMYTSRSQMYKVMLYAHMLYYGQCVHWSYQDHSYKQLLEDSSDLVTAAALYGCNLCNTGK